MSKKPSPNKDAKVSKPGAKGGAGITAGGNVNISNIEGQLAIGSHIKQKQTVPASDKQELLEALKRFREGAAQLELSEDDLTTVKGDITAAIKEAEKDKPDLPKIKSRFESALDTLKHGGQLVKKVVESPITLKILDILAKNGSG